MDVVCHWETVTRGRWEGEDGEGEMRGDGGGEAWG